MFTLALLGAKKSLALGGGGGPVAAAGGGGATTDEEGGWGGGGWANIEGGAPIVDPTK